MSLVGTRPILQDELRQYELHHRARIAIKPGITGMWQVSGRSDITDFEEVVRLDTEYISNGTSSEQARGYQFVMDGIRKLDSISVRDTRTQSAYQALTDKEIGVHVDPTFLIDLRKYAVKPKLDKYLLVYTYSFDADKIKRTKEFAKQKGLLCLERFGFCGRYCYALL